MKLRPGLLTRRTFAAPIFLAGGTATALASGTGTVPAPAFVTQANDIMLVLVHSAAADVVSLSGTGWAHVTGSPITPFGTLTSRFNLFWKRATDSSNDTNVTATNGWQAKSHAIRGCRTIGNPWNGTPVFGTQASSPAFSATGLTTTEPNSLVMIFICHDVSTVNGDFSGWLFGGVAATEISDFASATGPDGGCAAASLTVATQTTIATITATKGAASSYAYMVLDLTSH